MTPNDGHDPKTCSTCRHFTFPEEPDMATAGRINLDVDMTGLRILASSQGLATEVAEARIAAHKKHGHQSIEGLPASDPRRLPILVEEVGEVAKAMNYDTGAGDLRRVREELVDVAAVVLGHLAAIDRELIAGEAAPMQYMDGGIITGEQIRTGNTRPSSADDVAANVTANLKRCRWW